MLKPISFCLVATFALVSSAFAQNLRTATLVGTVTDSTGAVVPKAAVTVTNVQTQVVTRGVTNDDGAYYIPFLNLGNYELSIEAAGFKRFDQTGLTLNAGETPRIDVKLEIGGVSEEVKVTASAPLLETDTAVMGQVFDTRTVHEIPIMQAKAQNLMYYMEGAQVNNDGSFHILGLPQNLLAYSIDGAAIKQSVRTSIGTTTTAITPPVDSIAEAQVWSTGVPAEMGHTAGGAYNMVLKSGTNDLHFSAEERYINQDFLHRSYFQQGLETTPFEYHMFFSTLGGPVYIPKVYDGRNKTFLFLAYGLTYDHEQNPAVTSTPDPGMLAGNFNFPGINSLPIYDPKSITCPATANGCPSGVGYTATQFPGNQIPLSRFDPVAVNFLARNPYNLPNTAGFYSNTGPNNNYAQNNHYLSDRQAYIVKVDQQVTSNHKIFFRYAWNMNRSTPGREAVQFNWKLIDNTEFSYGQREPTDIHNFTFGDVYNIGPTLINEFRVAYQRRADTIQPALNNQGWASILGIPGVGPQTFPGFLGASGGSSVAWSANPGGTYNPAGNLLNVNEGFELNEAVTKVVGHHTFKAGYQMLLTRENDVAVSQPSGTYNFTTAGSGLPNTPNTGNTFASFLLGSVTSATFTTLLANYIPHWWSHQFFAQDDWRVTHNLTVSLGVRYSFETPAQTKYGFKSEFNPNVVDPLTGMMGAITHPKGAVYSTDLNNFTPRLGLSWNFRPKWVFRGSFGMFTQDVMPELGQEEYLATAAVQQAPGNPFPAFYLSQGPGSINYPINSGGTANYFGTNYSNRTATYIDLSLRNPYSMTWSGGFQWEFRTNHLLEAIYQGSSGVALIGSTNVNVLPQSIYNSTNTTLLNQVFSATQNYLAYPQFGAITATGNYGHSTYHALTTRMERRFNSGLRYEFLFVWSKNIAGTAGTGWQYYDWNLTKGIASTDIRLQFTPLASYDLPFGKNRRYMSGGGLKDYFLGGWTFFTIQSLRSGLPESFTMAGSPNRYLPGETQPNIVPGQKINVPNYAIGPNLWPQNLQNSFFNINAFSYPAAFTGGNAGVSIARTGAVWWPQYSLTKTVSYRERYKLTVRVDLNNLLPETRWLQTPNTTVNITSPQTFGKFAPAGGTSFSAWYTPSGHLIGILRLEF